MNIYYKAWLHFASKCSQGSGDHRFALWLCKDQGITGLHGGHTRIRGSQVCVAAMQGSGNHRLHCCLAFNAFKPDHSMT
eukprot:619283-Pelagomonas_calceolata.AAC.2